LVLYLTFVPAGVHENLVSTLNNTDPLCPAVRWPVVLKKKSVQGLFDPQQIVPDATLGWCSVGPTAVPAAKGIIQLLPIH
jgi:hypothetical protein